MDLYSILVAAENGGKVIKNYFGKALDIEEKLMVADYRTKADIESEKAILKVLTARFPQFNIYSEETGKIDKHSEYTFVIDPLDGSNNFVIGLPNFSVSIGLFRGDTAILGVIHLPMLDHTYYAQEGKGAFLHKKRLQVNKEADIKRATVSYTCGYINDEDYYEKLLHKLYERGVKRIMSNWTPALEYCLIASGKIEAIVNNDNELYDYAAGKVIAREAGALITDFRGKAEENDRNSKFLISNGTKLHQQIIEVL